MQEQLDVQSIFTDMFGMANKATEQFSQIVERLNSQETSENDPAATVMSDFNSAFMEFSDKLFANPQALLQGQMALIQGQMALWQQTALKFTGQESENIIEPEEGDRRFKDEGWSDDVVFNYLKQFYLLQSKAIKDIVNSVDDLSPHSQNKVDFLTRQFVNALSPSNFASTNPEVVRKTVETGGQNLVEGMELFSKDLKASYGGLSVTMSDVGAFQLGQNVATTKGDVVFENDLMQLIQYTPTTKKTFQRPLLVIPPFINKYYILDLQEKNSFLKWLVDQGHTVFCVSWNNPGPSLKDKGFDDYMTEGPLAAMDAIKSATGESDINAIGYCLGGTLLAAPYWRQQQPT